VKNADDKIYHLIVKHFLECNAYILEGRGKRYLVGYGLGLNLCPICIYGFFYIFCVVYRDVQPYLHLPIDMESIVMITFQDI
jgi:hypothetical protein